MSAGRSSRSAGPRARSVSLGLVSLGLGAAALSGAACVGTDPMPMRDAGPPPPAPARVQNIAAYEGQEAFVTVLESGGDDWTSAVVSSESPALEILAQACGSSLCGVVLRVVDTQRNTGQTIPAPIDGVATYLRVDAPAGPRQGLLRVLPLDALGAPAGETPVDGVYFASSVDARPGSVLRGMGDAPVRWVVFGSARIDTFDVSAGGADPGPGGGEGGASGAAGAGPAGGPAATPTAGAGGGGGAEPGGLGEMASAGADAADLACLEDLFATECGGGGGGGGASGAGGAGAGTVSLLVLGSLEIGTIRGLGGDGEGGGGGGGGGLVHLAASRLVAAPTLDLAGGIGEGTGGTGGAGGARIDGAAGSPVIRGPRVEVDPSSLVVRSASWTITGDAPPDRTIRIERVTETGATELARGTSDATGAFSIDVTLEPGLSRLRVVQVEADGAELRAFNGNHFELERRDTSAPPLPVGGLLDVAYIP